MNLVILSVFFMVIVLGIAFSFINIFGFGKALEMELIITRDVYTLENSLEAAKYVYARNALVYSFYQAAYNVSLQGGWKETGEEDEAGDAIADEETLKESLSALTMEYYNDHYNIRPMNHLGYFVFVPDYKNITITDMDKDSVTIEAYAEKLMEVSSELENPTTKEKITIRKNASMNLTIPTSVYKVYKKALTYSSETEASFGRIQHELNKWPLEASIEMDHAFSSSHNDAFYKIITTEYPQLIRDNDFVESAALNDAETIITSQISLPEATSTTEDGFIIDNRDSSVRVKITPSCTGYTYVQDGSEQSHKDCEFSYKVTVSLKTGIQEKDGPLYPVFNGTNVTFEPIRFVFSAEKIYERKL